MAHKAAIAEENIFLYPTTYFATAARLRDEKGKAGKETLPPGP
jgi:hypothetical protein